MLSQLSKWFGCLGKKEEMGSIAGIGFVAGSITFPTVDMVVGSKDETRRGIGDRLFKKLTGI